MMKIGVIRSPGSAFGTLGWSYVIFALVLPASVINDAVNRINESGLLETN